MSGASAAKPPVHEGTVDAIFKRLIARYGKAFEEKYPEAALPSVRADWLEQLQGLTQKQVMFAMVNLPISFPPNAAEFKVAALKYVADMTPGFAPCSFCQTSTRVAALSSYGARCYQCFVSYCEEGLDGGPKGRLGGEPDTATQERMRAPRRVA